MYSCHILVAGLLVVRVVHHRQCIQQRHGPQSFEGSHRSWWGPLGPCPAASSVRIVFFSHFCQLISSCSCMEHSLHVAVGHILSSITPVDAEKTRKADDDDDDDEFLAGAATFDDCSAMLSHALRKLLGLIVQIRKSPQARAFFKRMCRESNIPEHDLVLFVRTRWASMFA